MKKAIKIGLAIIVIALVVVAAQQGLKYYLKGPARYFNAIIVTGEDADVQAAKELYKDQSANVTEYPFKAINNPIAMLDENGEQMVKDGKPVFIDDIYLVLSKSTAKEFYFADSGAGVRIPVCDYADQQPEYCKHGNHEYYPERKRTVGSQIHRHVTAGSESHDSLRRHFLRPHRWNHWCGGRMRLYLCHL